MAIEFNCPSCGRRYAVADSNAGRRFACKDCSAQITVPAAATHEAHGAFHETGALRKKRLPNIAFIAAGALMLIGMALPWLSLPDSVPLETRQQLAGDASGFGLPLSLNDGLSGYVRMMDNPPAGSEYTLEDRATARSVAGTAKILYLLYLIPLLALIGLAEEVVSSRQGRNRWWMRAAVTATPAVVLAVVVIAFSSLAFMLNTHGTGGEPRPGNPLTVFSLLGIGVYVIGIAILVSLFSIFASPEPVIEKPHGPIEPPKPRSAGGAVRKPTSKVAARPISLPVTKAHPPSSDHASVKLPRKSGKLKPPTSV